MKAQLLKDLQNLQTKAANFFDEADESRSEHAGGYLYLLRRINKTIALVTGTSDAKPLQSLTDLRKTILDITKEYSAKTGVEYRVSISVECDENGCIKYSGEIEGLKPVPAGDRYGNRIYSRKTFQMLVAEFTDLLEADVEARKDDNESGKDITVK
jgi:hypothetical protein